MRINQNEIQSGKLTAETLTLVARQIQDVGFIILEQVIDRHAINHIYEAFLPILTGEVEQPDVRRSIEARSQYVRKPLPFTPPFKDETIFANPIALQVLEEMMDEIICTHFYYIASLQGGAPQSCHIDMTGGLFPGFPVALPPCFMEVNIPLIDITDDNGGTEVWPGTHLHPISGGALPERCKAMPSVRINARVGDLVIRDPRLWHRGMPNNTTEPRTMLLLLYCKPWYRVPVPPIELPPDWEDSLSERAKRLFTHMNVRLL